MAKIREFWDLDAWQEGHKLVVEIYKISKLFPKTETYGLASQIQRSACSVTANIAEGFSRYSYKDKARFYYHARGSLSETQNHLLVSRDVGYLNKEMVMNLLRKTDRVRKIINGLIKASQRME